MNPDITVIIATYNSSRTLTYTLQSLLDQEFKNFEAWIVGDACTDNSEKIVQSFSDPRLNWINLPANTGSQAFPNNEGLSRAKGDYIAYLGHDDLWFPWHLTELVTVIKQTHSDLVYPLVVMKDPDSIRVRGPVPAGRTFYSFSIPPSGWLHKRRIYEDGMQWPDNQKVRHWVDQTLLGQLSDKGYKIHFHPEISVLKFLSQAWRSYDPISKMPQKGYYHKLSEDPKKLQKELMIEIAQELAIIKLNQEFELKNKRESSFYSLMRKISYWYGIDRWPLSNLLLRFYQKRREQAWIERGL